MSRFLKNLGRSLGRQAGPALRKTRWVWQNLTGSEEDALQAEVESGRSLAAEVRSAAGPVDDPELAVLLAEVCGRLTARVRDKRRTFRCEALPGDAPNALALPGGFIFVSVPLVTLCERRSDELAFVIGHEMGHVLLGHAWDRMMEQIASRMVSAVSLRSGVLGQWVRSQGLSLLQSAHAREGERQADELGMRLAVAAGYASGGALALLGRFASLGADPGILGPYLSSHPPPAERRAYLERIRQAGGHPVPGG